MRKSVLSNPHTTFGFKMRLLVHMNGNGDANGTYIPVFIQLIKGEYDNCMELLLINLYLSF